MPDSICIPSDRRGTSTLGAVHAVVAVFSDYIVAVLVAKNGDHNGESPKTVAEPL